MVQRKHSLILDVPEISFRVQLVPRLPAERASHLASGRKALGPPLLDCYFGAAHYMKKGVTMTLSYQTGFI